MNKRFLFSALAVIVLGVLLVVLVPVVMDWAEHRIATKHITDEKMSELMAKAHGEVQALPPPIERLDLKQTVRLAIGGLGLSNDADNRRVADLALANLMDVPGLELVERQDLDLALREMSLGLSGLVRAQDAIRVGKLVRADWLLMGSAMKLNGTNSIVVRVVDARTGILREAGVFPADQGDTQLGSRLAAFVRQCRQDAVEARLRVCLAVGTFEDLSLNSRQAALPEQLRSFLTAAYQEANIALVEREYVGALLREVQLDLAGLTDEASVNASPMLSAYWLVEGYYQSYETSDYEVELVLNVRRMFGRNQQIALREKPGEPLFRRVKESIDGVMARDRAALFPTRVTELRTQMSVGWELLQSAQGGIAVQRGLGDWMLNTGEPVSEVARRRRNVEEAIRAFETALLLDPGNRKAAMGLAGCLSTRYIGRFDEARDLCRQVMETEVEDEWTEMARGALVRSFWSKWWTPLDVKRSWYEAALARSEHAPARQFFQAQLGAATEETLLSQRGTPEAERVAEERLLRDIQAWENHVTGRSRFVSFDVAGLGKYAEAFGTNDTLAARRMVALLPKLQAASTNLAPHILAGVVTFQVDTNAPIIEQFERSLAEIPEKSPRYFEFGFYMDLLSGPVCQWAEKRGLYRLAAKIMETRIQMARRESDMRVDDSGKMRLAFNYLRIEAWQEALQVFQGFSNRPIFMVGSGPWGRSSAVVQTSKQAALCREKLELPPVNDPREFDLSKRCLCLHDPSNYLWSRDFSVFATSSDSLWVGINDQMMNLDFSLRTNFTTRISSDRFAPVSVLCVGTSNVWMGTDGGGLFELDKATRNTRRFTEKDGLLMNHISSLYLAEDTLWIGYGNASGGGLGRLDLNTRRFTSFTASLSNESEATRPPRRKVTEIREGPGGDVWFIANSALFRCRPAENAWEEQPSRKGVKTRHYSMDNERLVQGLEIEQVELTIETEPTASSAGNPTRIITRIVSQDESGRLQAILRTNRGGQRIRGTRVGGDDLVKGRVEVRAFRGGHQTLLLESEALPNPPTTLTLQGRELWVGGQGFVALVDLAENRIKKLAYVPAPTVDSIQIGGGYVWALFDKHLHRAPLSDFQ